MADQTTFEAGNPSRRRFLITAGVMSLGSLAGCLEGVGAALNQGENMPLTTEYGDDGHLYSLPKDPLTAAIPEPPEEPQSVGEMNLYMSQMLFLQNVYLRETAYVLRELAENDDVPTAPWVSDTLGE